MATSLLFCKVWDPGTDDWASPSAPLPRGKENIGKFVNPTPERERGAGLDGGGGGGQMRPRESGVEY